MKRVVRVSWVVRLSLLRTRVDQIARENESLKEELDETRKNFKKIISFVNSNLAADRMITQYDVSTFYKLIDDINGKESEDSETRKRKKDQENSQSKKAKPSTSQKDPNITPTNPTPPQTGSQKDPNTTPTNPTPPPTTSQKDPNTIPTNPTPPPTTSQKDPNTTPTNPTPPPTTSQKDPNTAPTNPTPPPLSREQQEDDLQMVDSHVINARRKLNHDHNLNDGSPPKTHKFLKDKNGNTYGYVGKTKKKVSSKKKGSKPKLRVANSNIIAPDPSGDSSDQEIKDEAMDISIDDYTLDIPLMDSDRESWNSLPLTSRDDDVGRN